MPLSIVSLMLNQLNNINMGELEVLKEAANLGLLSGLVVERIWSKVSAYLAKRDARARDSRIYNRLDDLNCRISRIEGQLNK